jgi:hypothetical protein
VTRARRYLDSDDRDALLAFEREQAETARRVAGELSRPTLEWRKPNPRETWTPECGEADEPAPGESE